MAGKSKQESSAATRAGGLVNLIVNGRRHRLEIGDGPGKVGVTDTLSFTLRETLGLTGTKLSCNGGACGGCTIMMDGKAVLSCMLLTVECGGSDDHDDRGTEKPGDRRDWTDFNRPSSTIRPFSAVSARRE